MPRSAEQTYCTDTPAVRPARLPSLTRIASDRLECVLDLLPCGRSSIALPCLGSLLGGSPPLSSQSCLLGRSSPLTSRSALLSWGEFSHTLLLSLGLLSWPRACKSAPVGRRRVSRSSVLAMTARIISQAGHDTPTSTSSSTGWAPRAAGEGSGEMSGRGFVEAYHLQGCWDAARERS